jgi:hypothetical protein
MLTLDQRGEEHSAPQHIAIPQNIEAGRVGKSDLCRTADAQFLDSEAQSAGIEFQDRSGSGWPLDSPAGLLENPQDMFAFLIVFKISKPKLTHNSHNSRFQSIIIYVYYGVIQTVNIHEKYKLPVWATVR